MPPPSINDKLKILLRNELQMIWAMHANVGLKGYMSLYTNPDQVPFRSKEAGLLIWFGPEDTDKTVDDIIKHFNGGILPNSPLLLNPIVHEKKEDGTYVPLGSSFAWCTSWCLGIDSLNVESTERLWEKGVLATPYHRGDSDRAGLKIIAVCDEILPVTEGVKPVVDEDDPESVANAARYSKNDKKLVVGCRDLYDLANIHCPQYCQYYLLSGLSYLSNNGLFVHPDISKLYPKGALKDAESTEKAIHSSTINVQNVLDAAFCWNSYERYHSLYKKFGTNVDDVEINLRFFGLVARDVELFDATGPMRKDADAMFEFLVPGWIPRGAVTLIGATGGTGKSSLAHLLCILASIDYNLGEEAPTWLGQRLAIEKCHGINVYFSGEDGPPIINARAQIFDPEGRAKRLMFQRTDFGEGVTFAKHIGRLHKVPNVPIMVIDPARKYLIGDEEDSESVSEFFEAIEEFAIKKHAAMVVVHHLKKNAKPNSAAEVLDMLRGSQVFIDRPRVVIGMFREGPYTIAGLAKNNIPPNMGMVMEERVFARDPKKLGLIWLPGKEGIRNPNLTEDELQALADQRSLEQLTESLKADKV